MLHYKNYIGHVIFDACANIYHGKVVNILDTITFQGKTESEAKIAFIKSVDDYLEFCKERGEKPESPANIQN